MVGVIPTFHLGMRTVISDPDSIVNYVVRHVLMNPGSITSLHMENEVSVKKLDGDYPNKNERLASAFQAGIQSILDRYATDKNRFIVATEYVDNNDGKSATIKLSIKASYNDKLISYDRDFLVEQTKDFRTMIMDANKVNPDNKEKTETGKFTGTIAPVKVTLASDRIETKS